MIILPAFHNKCISAVREELIPFILHFKESLGGKKRTQSDNTHLVLLRNTRSVSGNPMQNFTFCVLTPENKIKNDNVKIINLAI